MVKFKRKKKRFNGMHALALNSVYGKLAQPHKLSALDYIETLKLCFQPRPNRG